MSLVLASFTRSDTSAMFRQEPGMYVSDIQGSTLCSHTLDVSDLSRGGHCDRLAPRVLTIGGSQVVLLEIARPGIASWR
jgi:hypothetical protein